jgi:hypothetical protein
MKQAVRALLGGAVLLSGLIPGPFMPRQTQAMMVMCRSDVSIRLHSSATITLSVSIADSVADVRQVTYSVHIPAGQGSEPFPGPATSSRARKISRYSPIIRPAPMIPTPWLRPVTPEWL